MPTTSMREVQSPGENAEVFAKVANLRHSDSESQEIVEAALEGASLTWEQVEDGMFPLHERLHFLEKLRERIAAQEDYLTQLLTLEIGKPIQLSRLEVRRAAETLSWTLLEATRLSAPEGLPTGSSSRAAHFEGFTHRRGRGPLLAITPFNYPVNLALHKLAPAWALGCPVILKPSPKSVASSLVLADLCHAAGLPAGMLSVLPTDNELTETLIQDPRIKQISFTGSASVGWQLARGQTKPFFLELGGANPAFVDDGADLQAAATALVTGAVAYAGQICISVQNIFTTPAQLPALQSAIGDALKKITVGSPHQESTLVGPVIDEAAATRLEALAQSALQAGARCLFERPITEDPLKHRKTFVSPRIFGSVPETHPLMTDEAFGPFATLSTIPSLKDFIRWANQRPGRFQVSLFTPHLNSAMLAGQKLKYGAILINEATNFRFEPMPFGGCGLSGNSREGPRYALEAFSELSTVLRKLS